MNDRVDIITIGNELLNGLTADSNTSWLCKRLTALGAEVRRVVLVPDEVPRISREISTALDERCSLVVTVGGLGMTADDLTLRAVSDATDQPLLEDEMALNIVARRYKHFFALKQVDSPELSPERRKMARLPQGAIALDQSTGAAPGVLLPLGAKGTIVSLPGVPAEMMDIFENALHSHLTSLFGRKVFVEHTFETSCIDESLLAGPLAEVARQNPDVYIKSHSRRFGKDAGLEVTVAGRGTERNILEARIREVGQHLTRVLRAHDVAVHPSGAGDGRASE